MSHVHFDSPPNCCDRFLANENVKTAFHVLEKISLIALTVLAAYISPRLFFPFFGVGIVLGTCIFWNKKVDWLCKQKPSCRDHEDQCSSREGAQGCSQGVMEHATGLRLPAPLGLGVNAALMVDHLIDHHSTVYVPMVALYSGYLVGAFIGGTLPKLMNCCEENEKDVDPLYAELEVVESESQSI